MPLFELQLDGLVGPTHNYAGLSRGNVASQRHAGRVAHPRDAALEGLAKMRALAERGVPQMVLPPQERPDVHTLRRLGFAGSDVEVLAGAARRAPRLLAAACSASSMWAANAATVTPSTDTADGRVHFTPANLVSTLHRSLEPEQTRRALERLFPGNRFVVHDPLPPTAALGDEGAANHTRLTVESEGPALHLFVYGRSHFADGVAPSRHRARQTREASEAVIRRHGLDPARAVLLQQRPATIDRGVFHNDVIAVGHGPLLLYHADAWVDADAAIARMDALLAGGLVPRMVTDDQLTVDEAVSTYLFNSQLVSAGGRTVLVAPRETRDHARARAVVDGWADDGETPIDEVIWLDVRQSMQNGGGPACLRLRVPLTEDELATVHRPCMLDAGLHEQLDAWVHRHYRETLEPDDLADPVLLHESRAALDELAQMLDLGRDFYAFQR